VAERLRFRHVDSGALYRAATAMALRTDAPPASWSEELADGMRIRGGTAPLSGRVVTHGDHRLAMAFGVLGALPGNDVEIDDRDCVAVSYPDFWRDLARVAG
jgi:hypothetical protein